MAFANANISDILATTIENRSRKLADNVSNNCALLKRLEQRGKIKTFSGGHKILQELAFAENANSAWYSGYDLLPVGASDVISAAEYTIKQAAVPVVMSGLEMLQNAGKEKMIDLMEGRIQVAEKTLANLITDGLYSDGTGSGGKEIDGLDAAVPTTPTTGTYGGINRANYTFWRPYYASGTTTTAANVQGQFNLAWANLTRGADRPDLIMVDNNMWGLFMQSLQDIQRITGTSEGKAGFPSIKFIDADVVLDGGLYPGTGTGATTSTAYFLNTDYLHYRPHASRNMVPLSPNRRYATNQDAEVQIIGWAGNLTCSGQQFQGRLNGA